MDAYLPVIRQSFYLFPVIAALFTIPYMLYNYHKYGSVWSLRILIIYSFILYLMTIFFLITLPLPSRAEVAALHIPRAQLQPFNFVRDILKESHIVLDDPRTWLTLIKNRAFLQFAFNVVMTMPFGMYIHYYFKRSFVGCLLLSFCLSLFFEISQLTGLFFIYPRNYRLFDVDDLLANTLGGALGWIVASPLIAILPKRRNIDAASYRRGEKVSLLRRLFAAGTDTLALLILYVVIIAFVPWFNNHGLILWIILLFGYFVVLPTLTRGRTFGMFVNSTRIARTKDLSENIELSFDPSTTAHLQPANFLAIFERYGLLFGFMIGMPWLMMLAVDILADTNTLVFLDGIILTGLLLVYLTGWASILKDFLFDRLPFYGKLSHTRIVSSIRIPAGS